MPVSVGLKYINNVYFNIYDNLINKCIIIPKNPHYLEHNNPCMLMFIIKYQLKLSDNNSKVCKILKMLVFGIKYLLLTLFKVKGYLFNRLIYLNILFHVKDAIHICEI